MHAFIGIKQEQGQKFLENGVRIPVTHVFTPGCPVVAVKQKDTHGYTAVQLGLGTRKKATKAQMGLGKGAKLEKAPHFLREIRVADEEALPNVGDVVKVSDVLSAGDIVQVTGISKGKGFAGGVKRHNFKGGPRTHGQSDRERAPGSIGQTTTPGRVYKGKRMAGHMGHEQVTVQNLEIVSVNESGIVINGLVPGPKDGLLVITKTGTMKKFVPLLEDIQAEEVKTVEETVQTPEETVVEPAEQVQPKEEGESQAKEPEVSTQDAK
jgi:large subunit ribosomal protein L3